MKLKDICEAFDEGTVFRIYILLSRNFNGVEYTRRIFITEFNSDSDELAVYADYQIRRLFVDCDDNKLAYIGVVLW